MIGRRSRQDVPCDRRRDLARLKSLGLDFVRLPLDPGPFLAATPSQRDTLFGDVMAAVRLALAQGLSVVVNPHINGATHHWNHGRLLMSADTPGFALYRALVVELAARLQRLDTSGWRWSRSTSRPCLRRARMGRDAGEPAECRTRRGASAHARRDRRLRQHDRRAGAPEDGPLKRFAPPLTRSISTSPTSSATRARLDD